MAAPAVPSTMKAAVVVKHGDALKIQDVPVPEVGHGQVLVKVSVTGVCHTDVHVADGDWDVKSPLPLIPGHEGCGVVVKVGPGVTCVKLGDRVGVPWLHKACGHCFHCRDGWETVCEDQERTGFSVNGGWAQYVVAPAEYVGKVPDGVSFEQAAPIMCAGVTVYKALKVSEVKPGQWVVITGAGGGLGHVACQYAKAMGMKVIGSSRSLTPEKEKMLKGFGVDYCIDLSKETFSEGAKKATGSGPGVQGVICLAPDNDDITKALDYIAPRGVIVPVAIPPGNFCVSTVMTVLKAVDIKGSIVGTRNDLEEAMDFAASGKVKCIVEVRKLDEVNAIVNDLRKGNIQGRVVMTVPQ